MNHFKPPSPSPCPCSPPHSAPRLHLSLTRERVLASTRHHEQRTADHQSTHRASATQLFQPNPSQSISSHPAHHTQKTTRALGPSPPPHGPPKPAPRVLSPHPATLAFAPSHPLVDVALARRIYGSQRASSSLAALAPSVLARFCLFVASRASTFFFLLGPRFPHHSPAPRARPTRSNRPRAAPLA